jgi:hypothetical protein
VSLPTKAWRTRKTRHAETEKTMAKVEAVLFWKKEPKNFYESGLALS